MAAPLSLERHTGILDGHGGRPASGLMVTS
jgi:hypothetical protein